MNKKIKRTAIFAAIIPIMTIEFFFQYIESNDTSPSIHKTTSLFTANAEAGQWAAINRINYRTIPSKNLKGKIGLPYLYYAVTIAGFHTESFGITVGPDGDVRYTTDRGKTWTLTENNTYCRQGLDIVTDKIAWHCGNNGIRLSTDGGRTWKGATTSLYPFISFIDEKTGWAASLYNLQETHDGAASWNSIKLPPGIADIAAIRLRTKNEGCLLDTDGNLFITTNGAKKWHKRSLGLDNNQEITSSDQSPLAAIRFFDSKHGLIVFNTVDHAVWLATSENGGKSWHKNKIPGLHDPVHYYFLYLSGDGRLLTATRDFRGNTNDSVVIRIIQ